MVLYDMERNILHMLRQREALPRAMLRESQAIWSSRSRKVLLDKAIIEIGA